MSVNQGPGQSTEVLQARLREKMELDEANNPSNPAGGAVAPPELPQSLEGGQEEEPQNPPKLDVPPPELPKIDAAAVEKTGRIPLAALPNDELAALCKGNNIDATSIKSRDEAVAALVAKGIESVPANQG